MHGHDIFFWQQKVLHGKHRFFHLSGVTHPGNQHLALTKVDDDGCLRVSAITFRVADEICHVEYLPLRLVCRVVGIWANEHVPPKQRLPCRRGDDFDW